MHDGVNPSSVHARQGSLDPSLARREPAMKRPETTRNGAPGGDLTIVTNVPSLTTRREHLTQSVVSHLSPTPKVWARGQMTQLTIPLEQITTKGFPPSCTRCHWQSSHLTSARDCRARDAGHSGLSAGTGGGQPPALGLQTAGRRRGGRGQDPGTAASTWRKV